MGKSSAKIQSCEKSVCFWKYKKMNKISLVHVVEIFMVENTFHVRSANKMLLLAFSFWDLSARNQGESM